MNVSKEKSNGGGIYHPIGATVAGDLSECLLPA